MDRPAPVASPPTLESLRRRALVPIFFLSGVAGLVYEVVWTRFLVQFLGNTAHAHAVVLATFMGGLAVGYAWLGGVADRVAARPDGHRKLLSLYAALEGTIGLYGLAFPSLMAGCSALYLGAARALGPDSALLVPLALLAAVAALALPSVLMGGTLPVLVAWAADQPEDAGVTTSRFYAVNSAGAVAGAFAAGFFLVETWGQRGTIYAAAALNLILAAGSVALSRAGAAAAPEPSSSPPMGVGSTPPAPLPARRAGARQLPFAAALLCGVAALVLEVAWIRLFSLIYGSSTQSFTVIVAAFITGITLGAELARRILGRGWPAERVMAIAAASSAVLVLASQPLFAWLPWLLGRTRMSLGGDDDFLVFQLFKFAVSFAMMVVPTVASGLLLPLAAQLGVTRSGHVGGDVGRVFAWNATGSVAGAALTGTWLIPHIGLRGALVVGVALYLAIGLGAALVGEGRGMRRLALGLAACALALPLAERAIGWDALSLNTGEFRRSRPMPSHDEWRAEHDRARLVFYEEGSNSTVAVQELADGNRFLRVNGKTDASNNHDALTQAGLAAVGAVAADRLDDALVIGFGSGTTVDALLKLGASVDVVEIEPAVLHAAPLFDDVNHGCLQDPRVHTHIADARNFLLASKRSFDLVVSEPSNPWVAGVGSLFTREFFEAVKGRLASGGAFVQWFHTYEMDDGMVRLVLRTLGHVFPDVTVWEFDSDIALVARATPMPHDIARLEARFGRLDVRRSLVRLNVHELLSLLSLQLASEAGFRALLDEGPDHVDDLPLLEYRAPRAQFLGAQSRFLSQNDQRAMLAPDSGLLILDHLNQRKLTPEALTSFTLLQAGEGFAPSSFRFAFLEKVLANCQDPPTLGRIIVAATRTGRFAEAELALAALSRLDPGNARTLALLAEVRIKRIGSVAASSDPLVRDLVHRCHAAPGLEVFHRACLEDVTLLGLPPG